MFETSVVHARAQAARGRLSLLTLSVIAHSAVIVGVIAYSVASIEFPTSAPDAYETLQLAPVVTIPPPLGDPNGGKKPEQPQQVKQATPPPQPTQPTAPNTISETIPVATTPTTDAGSNAEGPGLVDAPLGRADGVKDSIGDLNAPPVVNVTAPVNKDIIYQPYEVSAPVLLKKVDPLYPRVFQQARVNATVILRCVIDKNGRVRDPQVVMSGRTPFDNAVIEAVQQWRYKPASLRGEAVDSYLDVKVTFTITR